MPNSLFKRVSAVIGQSTFVVLDMWFYGCLTRLSFLFPIKEMCPVVHEHTPPVCMGTCVSKPVLGLARGSSLEQKLTFCSWSIRMWLWDGQRVLNWWGIQTKIFLLLRYRKWGRMETLVLLPFKMHWHKWCSSHWRRGWCLAMGCVISPTNSV